MTAQISDTFIYKGEEYQLIGFDGTGLMKPQDFGMEPESISSGCWRGFYSTYEITDDGIFLKEMTLREKDENYRPINEVMPTKGEYEAIYKGIKVRVPFNGRMRLAKGFIRMLYVHQGFQKPSAFETVIDLKFEDGRLVEVKDRSKEVEAIRGRFRENYEKMEIIERINKAYSMDMDLE